MPSHVFHRLYLHFTWSVKNRLPLLDEASHQVVVEAVRTACEERGAEVLAGNAMPDHVHLLVRLPPSLTPSTFIGQVRGAASFAYNRKFGNRKTLQWQDGYGVVSLREGDAGKVVRYVEDQQ